MLKNLIREHESMHFTCNVEENKLIISSKVAVKYNVASQLVHIKVHDLTLASALEKERMSRSSLFQFLVSMFI